MVENQDRNNLQSARVTQAISPPRGQAENGAGNDNDETDWYKPDLGEIPVGPLTKKNREKIREREVQIE